MFQSLKSIRLSLPKTYAGDVPGKGKLAYRSRLPVFLDLSVRRHTGLPHSTQTSIRLLRFTAGVVG